MYKIPKRFSDKEIKEIIQLKKEGCTQTDIKNKYKASSGTISAILREYAPELTNLRSEFKIIPGQKFNKLTVIKYHKDKFGGAWECRCDCGSTVYAFSHALRHGLHRGCRCNVRSSNLFLNDPEIKSYPMHIRRYYYDYRTNAIKRKYTFLLTADFFAKLVVKNCRYCGTPPEPRNLWGKHVFLSGLDRLDNNKGYEETNVVPCCKICNRAKYTFSLDYWLDWLKRLNKNYDFYSEK